MIDKEGKGTLLDLLQKSMALAPRVSCDTFQAAGWKKSGERSGKVSNSTS